MKKYDSTVARIAGNLLSGMRLYAGIDPRTGGYTGDWEAALVALAVRRARFIIAEVERTTPDEQDLVRTAIYECPNCSNRLPFTPPPSGHIISCPRCRGKMVWVSTTEFPYPKEDQND